MERDRGHRQSGRVGFEELGPVGTDRCTGSVTVSGGAGRTTGGDSSALTAPLPGRLFGLLYWWVGTTWYRLTTAASLLDVFVLTR